MADASLQIGNNNWAVKSSLLLGYNIGVNGYSPVEMDVVRATSATRTNELGIIDTKASNIARINYTSGVGSLLIEPQRTNLITYSEQFDNVTWTKADTTVTQNSQTSPDGAITADTFIANGLPAFHAIQISSQWTISIVYTISVYVKKNTNNFIQLIAPNLSFGLNAYANFNVDAGVLGTVGSSCTATISNVGNGWFRCSLTATATSTSTSGISFCLITSQTSARAENNTLSTSVYMWGAQMEQGAYPTSYIQTIASTVTRNADLISKIGISDLIGQTEGTLFCDLIFTNLGTERYIMIVTDTSTLNSISLRMLASNAIRAAFSANTSSGTTNQSSAVLPIGNYKLAYTYKSGSLKLFINGALSFTLTPTFTFGNTLNTVRLGMDNGNNIQLGDSINSVKLYKTALTDQECITLTTL